MVGGGRRPRLSGSYDEGAMEMGLIIIGFLYIALSVGAILNLFLRSQPRRQGRT
jgi:hypothetical protein